MPRTRFLLAAGLSLVLLGCPQGPDDPTGEGCLAFDECGECAGQPQCGWCMEGGAGTCIPARSETDRATPPASCTGAGNTWHTQIPDHVSLQGAPYCPRVAPPDAQAPADDTTGGEEPDQEEAPEAEAPEQTTIEQLEEAT